MSNKLKEWIKCASVRAIKTVCQTAVGLIGTAVAFADVDWKVVVSASLLAGLTSLLTSVAGLPETTDTVEDDDVELAVEENSEALEEVTEDLEDEEDSEEETESEEE